MPCMLSPCRPDMDRSARSRQNSVPFLFGEFRLETRQSGNGKVQQEPPEAEPAQEQKPVEEPRA